METRLCSPVFLVRQAVPTEVALEHRVLVPGLVVHKNHLRMLDAGKEEDIIEDLQRLLIMADSKRKEGRMLPDRHKEIKKTWKERVNSKRQAVALALASSDVCCFKRIARDYHCSLELVKTVRDQMQVLGRVTEYRYNNLHEDDDIRELHAMIEEPAYKYYSTRDYKRVLGKFSVKRIRRELKEKGRRWKRMLRNRVKSEEKSHPKATMLQLISHITDCHLSEDKVMLFADEMKFPLYQTPNYIWVKPDGDDDFYNNRQDNLQITAIVLCSRVEFLAVQFFTEEVTANDFLYFMQNALASLQDWKQYHVLVDNATWHVAKLLKDSDVWRFLLFNVPGQFKINLIENSFSGVRAMWRQRKEVHSLAEELVTLTQIFFDSKNKERFEGYYYNHIRAMLSYFEDY